MSVGFETPSHDTLIAEQALVQAQKFQGRLLHEYDNYIFPGQSWREPRGSAVTDFMKPFIGDIEVSLQAVLQGLSEARPGQPVNWVDMGGGRALPMRQLAGAADMKPWLRMTNVDLFNFGIEGLEPSDIEYLEDLAPGMTKQEAAPTLIEANVETVVLPTPADIITSVEAMQYLNNPLEALANWYNQLADNGLMIVATEHDWPSWIRYQREPGSGEREETPTKHLLEELARHGINFAATDESDWASGRPVLDPNSFRILAVQKKPGTLLKVTRPVNEIWVNPWKFKAAYYEVPSDSTPLVEVASSTTKSIGGITLGLIR